ncbi:VirB4 family type IV secretion system protein [Sulfolobus acidocaldarius]|uniref:VirB4 family type IV secretion system protein n=1 Tax=Sulfolobus acidocaldarius TaxID=2285 RepID=UPI000B5AA634|nr:ATP-binding protein [Sulfolobus acidocaldarius]
MLALFNKQKEVKLKHQTKREFWYRLDPGPFELLTDQERDQLEGNFLELLHQLDRGTIVVHNDTQNYVYENEVYEVQYNKFYLVTDKELNNLQKIEKLSRPKIKRIHPDYLELENGALAQSTVFYKYPDIIPEGALYEYFGLGDVVIKFESLDPVSAAQSVDAARKRLEGLGATDSFAIRKLQKVRELQSLIGGQAKLMKFWVWITYFGKDKTELKEKYNQIRDIARSRLFDVDVPRFYQHALYNFRTEVNFFFPFMNSITPKYTDSITASWALYPLISEDLLDENGVFVGFSETGSPVLFNPYMRNNHNIVVLGETGSGKSMTSKILLKRMKEKYGIKIWGIDPENEYVKVAGILGLEPVIVRKGQPLGLDPFKLSRVSTEEGRLLDVEDIAEILADFYLPDSVALRNRLRMYVSDYADSETIFEFLENIRNDNELYNYLRTIEAPPDKYVFDGIPPTRVENIVFGLKEISGSGASRLKAVITTLLSLIYQKEAFGDREKGYIFIDEAWLFVKHNITMSLLENLARRARKYNKGLLFITQRPFDVAANEAGRTILEQSATVFLLRQKEAGVKTLKEVYNIRDEEGAELIKADPGHGILRTGNYLLRIYVQPSAEELQMFKTTGAW